MSRPSVTSWGHSLEQGWTAATPRLMAPHAMASEISVLWVSVKSAFLCHPPPIRRRWTLAMSSEEHWGKEGRGEAREGGREKGIHSPGSLPWCRVGQGAGPSSLTNNLCDLGKGRIGCPPGKAELEAERFPGSKAVVKRLRHFQHNHLKKWPGDRSPRIQNAGLRGGPGPRGRLAPLKCRFYPGISLRTRCLRRP